jgi:hypothetical protein
MASRDLGKMVWPDGPLLPPLRSGPSLPATGLRFAPSEVSLSVGRQNLDHNSTLSSPQMHVFVIFLNQRSCNLVG